MTNPVGTRSSDLWPGAVSAALEAQREPNPILIAIARGIYEAEGTAIPWEGVPEKHAHYIRGAGGGLQVLKDSVSADMIYAYGYHEGSTVKKGFKSMVTFAMREPTE